MVFSSYVFIFIFLPLVLAGYYLLSKMRKRVYQHSFLILASLFFYGYFNLSYLLVIIVSIVVNYLLAMVLNTFGNKIDASEGRGSSFTRSLKIVLAVGILFNVGMLGYFKYYNFFVENINIAFNTSFMLKRILLPLGISFFTFQQLSFLISIYKGEEKLERFIDYCVFVLFFPQLAAGPIVLYSEMMPQFTDEHRRYPNFDNIAKGLYLFAIGFFKKAVLADTLALFVNNGFGMSEISLSAAWVATLAYTLQIYFDFSGYSDMAMGLGSMFNIDLPVNFRSPYKSESVTEFWRRWHVTLGRALGKLVYIPLGGNRKGIFRVCINLFVTFLISGFWHGAAWTFVIWGALHGIAVVFERLFKDALKKIPKVLRIAGTFTIVALFRILFRAASFSEAVGMLKGVFNFRNIDIFSISRLSIDGLITFPRGISLFFTLSLIVGLLVVVFFTKNSIEKVDSFSPGTKNMIFTIVLFCISIIHCSKESIFIYFTF